MCALAKHVPTDADEDHGDPHVPTPAAVSATCDDARSRTRHTDWTELMRLVTDTTPRPAWWPRDREDLHVWLPYAIETLSNIGRAAHADHYRKPNRPVSPLRKHVRLGVAATAGWALACLPVPVLRDSVGTWMSPDAAVRILSEAGIATTFMDLIRLLDVVDGIAVYSGGLVTVPLLDDVLAVHAADFDPKTVVAHALRHGNLAMLCRWANAGLTGDQWTLANRAALAPEEVESIITTGLFPDRSRLELLAAFNTGIA